MARVVLLVFVSSLLLPGSVTARTPCPEAATATLPSACLGEASATSTSFCFAPEAACLGTGIVLGLVAPQSPFSLAGLRLDGPLGSRALDAGDFPRLLLPSESIVADVSATLTSPGTAYGSLAWVVTREIDEEELEDAETCRVNLVATVPACGGAAPGSCAGEACVAGQCVPLPSDGACDDGDACTVGDTCVDGACLPGPPKECPSDACTTGAVCIAGACVGTPVSCNDGNACTTDSCDPLLGCVAVPITGGGCDDRDPCTSGDRCDAGACRGTPIRCPRDGYDCTEERCVGGACESVAIDGRCDGEECVVGACRPDDAAADERGCVTVPVGEGETCTDDGVPCTDDVCTGGGCLHVPIDSRCASADECTAAACAPAEAARDARGCAPVAGAAGCPEDGDPCSEDVCEGSRCDHVEIAAATACAPLRGAFRKARGLATLTRNLMSVMHEAPGSGGERSTGDSMAHRLEGVAVDLDGAAGALAGKEAAPASAGAGAVVPETLAQERARMALAHVLRTPRQVRFVLAGMAELRGPTETGRETVRTLRRRGRLLLRGTKTLKGELRRLQQVSQTFAR